MINAIQKFPKLVSLKFISIDNSFEILYIYSSALYYSSVGKLVALLIKVQQYSQKWVSLIQSLHWDT